MAEQHSSKSIMWVTIIVAVVLIVAAFVATNRTFSSAADSNKGTDESDVRIQPVAKFELAKAAPASDGKPKDGATVYTSVCSACHASGAAGAPKTGDKGAWAPRIAQGKDALYKSVINGKGAMPPKGGATSLSDDEIKAGVDHLVGLAK